MEITVTTALIIGGINLLIIVGGQIAGFAFFMGKIKQWQAEAEKRDVDREKRMKELSDDVYDHLNNEAKHANKARDAEVEKRFDERFNQSDLNLKRLEVTISQHFQSIQSLIESLKPNRSRNRE
jgi:biopolymer transport protein ExbB/TolQ